MAHCISIHHGCEGVIEKSVLRITDWPHKACRVMTNGDPDGKMDLGDILTRIMHSFSSSLPHFIMIK